MASLSLPPDPYKLLGVTKDAKLPEIRSAHRKLVLKCHPDKVQDAALKAIKVDEFQKVQQAYELLSDDTRRLQYDEQVKLFELRKEMGRGNPTARSNPFEYEVKTAEPRPNSYSRPQASPKVYSYPTEVPRSREDIYAHDDTRHMPKKPSSFEERDRKRASQREEEMRRDAYLRKQHEDEERMRQREKDSKRSAHKEKTKSRDKDRKRGSEEKASRTRGAYVEDDSSDEFGRTPPPRSSDKKSSRHRASMEDDIRIREDAARADEARRASHSHAHIPRVPPIKEAPLDPKWSEHMDFAGAYMQAARRKVVEEVPHAPHVPHPGMRRSETMPSNYNIKYTTASPTQYSDDDSPKRSSGRRTETRRTSDTPSRKRSKERSDRKRSPSHPRDPYISIIEPPSPPPVPTSRKIPTLHKSDSAPPVFVREKPSRSKTEYPRSSKVEPHPSLPRASTFGSSRDRGSSSKLRQEISSDSESDEPTYAPPPRQREARYVVENGRANPVANSSRHREAFQDLNDYPRDRSQSPHGTPTATYHATRPPLTRATGSSERMRSSSRTHNGTSYYTADAGVAEPIILSARPKPGRETSSRSYGAGPFEKVKYAQAYTPENVIYSNHPAANLYKGSGGRAREDDYYNYGGRDGRPVYAVS